MSLDYNNYDDVQKYIENKPNLNDELNNSIKYMKNIMGLTISKGLLHAIKISIIKKDEGYDDCNIEQDEYGRNWCVKCTYSRSGKPDIKYSCFNDDGGVIRKSRKSRKQRRKKKRKSKST